ncbi:MAG: metallophosphoesterase family protein [Desulfobacterales bacterium]|nr:metallophosphoesterase family protein [Desulfobacterales bacterium]
MRYAILSDVHANLEALTAVVADLERRGADRILFLGDAVGYGADPLSCLDLIESRADVQIAGNHDQMTATVPNEDDKGGGGERASIRWTRGRLGGEARQRLLALDLEWTEGDLHCVHGSPFSPETWHYILNEKDAETGFAANGARIIFVGHTHLPAVFAETECRRFFWGVSRKIRQMEPKTVSLSMRYRYIINPGSVGQPRDGDPRAAYGIYCPEEKHFSLCRVPYDIEQAAQKIRSAGLSHDLAQRLFLGK